MGQRHQAFLIARVRPHGSPPDHPGNRRCIAAFHHQWCYGSLPLRAMRRLVSLVSQPDNAAIIRAELRAIDGKFGSCGAEEPIIPDIPCPYTASLLGCGWTTQLGDENEFYSSGTTLEHALLPADMDCWGGDNNDGISVLDVTDPEKPSYCFLRRSQPLDARGYLGGYYHVGSLQKSVKQNNTGSVASDGAEPGERVNAGVAAQTRRDRQWRQDLQRFIEDLADIPVIPAAFLREAWPHHFQRSGETVEGPGQPSEILDAGSGGIVSSLADISLDIAVKHSIASGDTWRAREAHVDPGKASQVNARLLELEHFTDSAAHLLGIALKELKETSRVDLTGFRLSGAHVAAVLSALGEVRSVDLSDNADIIADDVLDIVAAAPTLRRIVLMGCTSVDDARLLELVTTSPASFKTVEGILHPAFLTIKKPDPYPCAFTYVAAMASGNLSCVSLPFFTPGQIIQAVTDVIPWKNEPSQRDLLVEHFLPLVGCSAFQSGTRQSGQHANERTVVSVPFLSPRIPRGQKELWTFVCLRPKFRFNGDGIRDCWGFVHYTVEDVPDSTADGAPETVSDTDEPAVDMDFGEGRVYDLRGFLECMAREGRPMPAEEDVKKLEDILFAKDAETGDYYCAPLRQEDVSKIDSSWMPLRYQEWFSL
ncbi:hypothetical protein C8T65DRAFT_600699 [Cerioporus squamosus]|nr:hypothetical protein C8T65DRAFT_600699 [Cerioporus squamosus]